MLSWHGVVGQVTALGQPKLLERVSNGLIQLRRLFQNFDINLNGEIDRDEFAKVLQYFLSDLGKPMSSNFLSLM